MTFNLSPSCSRELRKSSGRPPETSTFNVLIHREEIQVRLSEGSQSGGLTQLVSAERQTGGVLVQVLVEIDAQVAQLLLDGLDLLLQQSTIKSINKRFNELSAGRQCEAELHSFRKRRKSRCFDFQML